MYVEKPYVGSTSMEQDLGSAAKIDAAAMTVDAFASSLFQEPLDTETKTAFPEARKAALAAIPALAMMTADAAAFLVATAALWISGPDLGGLAGPVLWPTACLLATASLCLNATSGLYPGYRITGEERLRRRAMAAGKVALLGLAGLWFTDIGTPGILPLTLLLATALALQPVFGQAARLLLRCLGLWGKRVTIIASPPLAKMIARYLTTEWALGLRPESESRLPSAPPGRPVSTAVIAIPDTSLLCLDRLRAAYSEVILLADIPLNCTTGLRPKEIGGVVGLRLCGGRPPMRRSRRALDLILTIPMILVALPIIGICALAIRFVDPGSAFYAQTREGLDGKPIRVLKLRTMYRDAESRLQALLLADPELRREWERCFKLQNDPRILQGIGRLLRRTSLDELPQLFNVLAGDMSLIGPRPFPVYHIGALDPGFRVKRATVTPGLTGLWQISGRSEADLELSQKLDEYYIDNQSFWLDLRILLSTAGAVIKRGGAY